MFAFGCVFVCVCVCVGGGSAYTIALLSGMAIMKEEEKKTWTPLPRPPSPSLGQFALVVKSDCNLLHAFFKKLFFKKLQLSSIIFFNYLGNSNPKKVCTPIRKCISGG